MGKARWVATLVGSTLALGGLGAANAGAAGGLELRLAFYAAPDGRGVLCTVLDPCPLERARDRVRLLAPLMLGDIEVRLRGGTYRLTRPFRLDQRDSGRNGHQVVYRPAFSGDRPVLSGGRQITGWEDAGGGVWKAAVPPGTRSRQLYVNGVRAQRARELASAVLGQIDLSDDDAGYIVSDGRIRGWRNPSDLELVYQNGLGSFLQANWSQPRCGVASVAESEGGRSRIVMRQPCFGLARTRVYGGVVRPRFVENAYELMDQPGEWYLDSPGGTLYYRPRSGESMASAKVVLPVLEQIVTGTGTPADPIHDLRLEGLTFAHATWLGPSSDTGFAEGQANLQFQGEDKAINPDVAPGFPGPVWPPGNVAFKAARDVVFDRDTFVHLGGQGLSLDDGSQGNIVRRSTFSDISSNGIRVGDIDDQFAPAPRQDRANTIADNVVSAVGVEYKGAVGIAAGKVADTIIAHNEVSDLSYSGISMGYGAAQGAYAARNVVAGNDVHDFMKELSDGGGIYVNHSQPGSIMSGNWIHGDRSSEGRSSSAMYLDNGSREWDVFGNVVSQTGENGRWLNVQSRVTPYATANRVHDNFSDTLKMLPCLPGQECEFDPNEAADRGNTYGNNAFVPDGQWPPAALDIMERAGVREEATG